MRALSPMTLSLRLRAHRLASSASRWMPSRAAENTAAWRLFEKGEYLAAAKAAAVAGSAVSLALAARATLADATLAR